MHNPNLADLIDRSGGTIRVGCDTEFDGLHTLTAQFAARVGDAVAVQVYHSPAIDPPPKTDLWQSMLPPRLKQHYRRLLVRPAKVIQKDLSPVRMFADLFGLASVEPVSKTAGGGAGGGAGPPLTLQLVAHYWPADFFRVFSAEFFTGLLVEQPREGRLVLQAHKTLAFKDARGGHHRFADPVLEFARQGGVLHPVRVRYFDTCLPFGKRPLNDLTGCFLGVPKLQDLGQTDKADMRAAFLRKPAHCYAYAVLDSILALLLEEKMRQEDERMYAALGFDAAAVPPLRPTQGGRVVETLVRSVARAAAGSVVLSQKGKPLADGLPGKVSLNKVKRLLAGGSGDRLAAPGGSRFGCQTADVHGGLLFSRSPTRFFHDALGQFRDVDLGGCYAAVLGGLSLYAGAPVVHEPGARALRLAEAIDLVGEHAAGPDGWIVKVSGPISAAPNVLLPSTRGALTHANYQSRAARKRSRLAHRGGAGDGLDAGGKDARGSSLYTDVVEAGIVAWPTWLMIQAMPPPLRQQYEDLEVETVLFYPKQMVADSGPAYDALVEHYQGGQVPWRAEIDMDALHQVVVEQFSDENVALRFDLGELARKFSELRQRAKDEHGKGSGAELAWKQHANSVYGVLASRHLVTHNVVCSNVVTATARALAFALQMSLNGFQVITDGCVYRRDQIPVGTFAECLAKWREYPIRRPEAGVACLDPAAVPQDDAAFTAWYAHHVQRFFEVRGPEYARLFGLHRLEHKACGDPAGPAFDGLCCDGSANYLKLRRRADEWEVADFKARSFAKEAKEVLAPWILQTYRDDEYTGPPPVTESCGLLGYQEAGRVARKAVAELETWTYVDEFEAEPDAAEPDAAEPVRVYFPLGLERRRAQAYQVLKASAFLFRTPEQQEIFARAMEKFAERHGCGLEALALRRAKGRRQRGSLTAIAEKIYGLIRAGEDNPTKALNLTRKFTAGVTLAGHHEALLWRKRELELALIRALDARSLAEEATLTGLLLERSDLPLVR